MSESWQQYQMRVPYKDTDQMGVVHHGNYIFWFEAARIEFMRHYGFSYFDLEERGFYLPVIDVNINYKKSAHFDDAVGIFTKINSFSPIRLTFYYEARRINKEVSNQIDNNISIETKGELLAYGTTEHTWMNADWKPARIHKTLPEVYQILKSLTS
ncbi:acyl-CoA thioesterase [Paucisalibacillus globulus]|uniref:acyl-CoA thioesterase n=1 Tax=Paucisalibacillus globulus TaxID=351095 RepID=UPI00040A5AB5|nr:thioesterase family protein [Paucisalibacillus globulus]